LDDEDEPVHRGTDHRILREQEGGITTVDVCRRHGTNSATFFKWKARFGGPHVSDARKLKALEDENAELKKLLVEVMLDNAMLKDIATTTSDARWDCTLRRRAGVPPIVPTHQNSRGSVCWEVDTISAILRERPDGEAFAAEGFGDFPVPALESDTALGLRDAAHDVR
jgi:putative transposase